MSILARSPGFATKTNRRGLCTNIKRTLALYQWATTPDGHKTIAEYNYGTAASYRLRRLAEVRKYVDELCAAEAAAQEAGEIQ